MYKLHATPDLTTLVQRFSNELCYLVLTTDVTCNFVQVLLPYVMFLNSERTNKSLQIISGQCNYDFVEQNEHKQSNIAIGVYKPYVHYVFDVDCSQRLH